MEFFIKMFQNLFDKFLHNFFEDGLKWKFTFLKQNRGENILMKSLFKKPLEAKQITSQRWL